MFVARNTRQKPSPRRGRWGRGYFFVLCAARTVSVQEVHIRACRLLSLGTNAFTKQTVFHRGVQQTDRLLPRPCVYVIPGQRNDTWFLFAKSTAADTPTTLSGLKNWWANALALTSSPRIHQIAFCVPLSARTHCRAYRVLQISTWIKRGAVDRGRERAR